MSKHFKIYIFGGFCSGKTTFAKKISNHLDIEVINLDDYFWFGNWENIGKENLLNYVKGIVNTKSDWIIEGNYSSVRNYIWEQSTHIYYCYTTPCQLIQRVIKRSFDSKRSGVPMKIKMETDNREPFFELLYNSFKYYFVKRKRDLAFCDELKQEGINIKIIKCDINSILDEIKNLNN